MLRRELQQFKIFVLKLARDIVKLFILCPK